MFRRLYSDGSKSIASLPSLPANQPQQPSFEVDTSFRPSFLSAKSGKGQPDQMEMTDCHHVYTNPGYPADHMQIGGLPFYLPRDHSQKTSSEEDPVNDSKQTLRLFFGPDDRSLECSGRSGSKTIFCWLRTTINIYVCFQRICVSRIPILCGRGRRGQFRGRCTNNN